MSDHLPPLSGLNGLQLKNPDGTPILDTRSGRPVYLDDRMLKAPGGRPDSAPEGVDAGLVAQTDALRDSLLAKSADVSLDGPTLRQDPATFKQPAAVDQGTFTPKTVIEEAPSFYSAFNAPIESFMPNRLSESETKYVLDPRALIAARQYNLEHGFSIRAMESAPGMGQALYGMLTSSQTGERLAAGATPAAVREFDLAMQHRTLGQSNWFFGVPGGQLGNRGPIDSLLIRTARRLDQGLSRGQAQEGAFEQIVTTSYDATQNIIGNIAGYYMVSLPFMRLGVQMRQELKSFARLAAKKSALTPVSGVGRATLDLLPAVDRWANSFSGHLIDHLFTPVARFFGAQFESLSEDVSDMLLDRQERIQRAASSTTPNRTFSFHRLRIHEMVDEVMANSILKPLSSQGFGFPFTKVFNYEFLFNNLRNVYRVGRAFAQDLRTSRIDPAEMARFSALSHADKVNYLADPKNGVFLKRLMGGAERKLYDYAVKDPRARINLIETIARDHGSFGRTSRAVAHGLSYAKAVLQDAFLGFGAEEKTFLQSATGAFGRTAIMLGVGAVVANQWLGEMFAAQRATVGQQRRFRRAINDLNDGTRENLDVWYTPGLPMYDVSWGAKAGPIGRAAGLVAGMAQYQLWERPAAAIANLFAGFHADRFQRQLMGPGAWSQAVTAMWAGRFDDLSRTMTDAQMAGANRAALLADAAQMQAGGNFTMASKLLIRSMLSGGANQQSYNTNTSQSVALQWSPSAQLMTLTLAGSVLRDTATFSLTLQGPVALPLGASLTMPFGLKKTRHADHTTSWDLTYVPNSSAENLSYLATYYYGSRAIMRNTLGRTPLGRSALYQNTGTAVSWLSRAAMLPLWAPGRLASFVATGIQDWRLTRELMAAGLTDRDAIERIKAQPLGHMRAVQLQKEMSNAPASLVQRVARQTWSTYALMRAADPTYAARGANEARAVAEFNGSGFAKTMRWLGRAGAVGAAAMVGARLGISLWGEADEVSAARFSHKLSSFFMNFGIPGEWAANFFQVRYKTHPILNTLAQKFGPEFGDPARYKDYKANLWGLGQNVADVFGGALKSVFYGSSGNAFTGTGFYGVVDDRVGDVLTPTTHYVQPGLLGFSLSYAAATVGMKPRADVDAFFAALNAQAGSGFARGASNLLRMNKKAASVGKLFHDQSGVRSLGPSARMELQRRTALMKWALTDNDAVDMAFYFYLNNRRRDDAILSRRYGVKLESEPYAARSVQGAIGHLGQQVYDMFKAARNGAALSGELAELDFQGLGEFARTDSLFSAPKGVNAFTAHEQQYASNNMLMLGLAAQIGLTAGSLGLVAGGLLSRGLRGEEFLRAAGKTTRDVMYGHQPDMYMTTIGVDYAKDGSMLFETGSPFAGEAMHDAGHRWWVAAIGGKIYTYGGIGLHGQDPLAGRHGKLLAPTGPGGLVLPKFLPNFQKHQNFFRVVSNINRLGSVGSLVENGRYLQAAKTFDRTVGAADELHRAVRGLVSEIGSAKNAAEVALNSGALTAEQRALLEFYQKTHADTLNSVNALQQKVDSALSRPTTRMNEANQLLQQKIKDIKANAKLHHALGFAPSAVEKELAAWLTADPAAALSTGERIVDVMAETPGTVRELTSSLVNSGLPEATGMQAGEAMKAYRAGGGRWIFANSWLREVIPVLAKNAIAKGLKPGTWGFKTWDAYTKEEAIAKGKRIVNASLRQLVGSSAGRADIGNAFADMWEQLVNQGAADVHEESLHGWRSALQARLAPEQQEELINKARQELTPVLRSRLARNAGRTAFWLGHNALGVAKTAAGFVGAPLIGASTLSLASQSYTGALFGLGVAADRRRSLRDREGAAQAALNDTGTVVRSSLSLIGARGAQLGWGMWKAGRAAYATEIAGGAAARAALGAGWKAAAGSVGRMAVERVAALGASAGLGLLTGGMTGSLAGAAVTALAGAGLAIGGAELLVGAMSFALSYVAIEALLGFTPLGRAIEDGTKNVFMNQGPAAVDWLNRHPWVSGGLAWVGRGLGTAQSALDNVFEAGVRRGQAPGATAWDRFVGGASGLAGSMVFRVLSPSAQAYRFYDNQGAPGSSLTLDPGAWRLPENRGSAAGLARMTPLFHGSVRDATTDMVVQQESYRQGSANALLAAWFHPSLYGQPSNPADSVMTAPVKRGRDFGGLDTFGKATQTALSVRAEATQFQLSRLLDRTDVWGFTHERDESGRDVASFGGHALGVILKDARYMTDSGYRKDFGVVSRVKRVFEAVMGVSSHSRQVFAPPATFRGETALPARGPITSDFGPRPAPLKPDGTYGSSVHKGVDIGASYGSPIYAAGSGQVVHAGPFGNYGNLTVIKHDGGLFSVYGHQADVDVRNNQEVRAGQPIGHVGNTGGVQTHLHFEVRVGDGSNWQAAVPVNPLPYLRGAKLGRPAAKAPSKAPGTSSSAPAPGSGALVAGALKLAEVLGLQAERVARAVWSREEVKGFARLFLPTHAPYTERYLSTGAVRDLRKAAEHAWKEMRDPTVDPRYSKSVAEAMKRQRKERGLTYYDYPNDYNNAYGLHNLIGRTASSGLQRVSVGGKPYWHIRDIYDFNKDIESSDWSTIRKHFWYKIRQGQPFSEEPWRIAGIKLGEDLDLSYNVNMLIPVDPRKTASSAQIEAFRKGTSLMKDGGRSTGDLARRFVNEQLLTMTPFGGAAEGHEAVAKATIPVSGGRAPAGFDQGLYNRIHSYDRQIRAASHAYGVPEDMLRAVMAAESQGNARATSPVGAAGLMQVMPFHFKAGEDRYDPTTNINKGAAVLAGGLQAFDGDIAKGIAAYNAGAGAVALANKRGNPIPTNPETSAYVPRVLGYLAALAKASGDATLAQKAEKAAAAIPQTIVVKGTTQVAVTPDASTGAAADNHVPGITVTPKGVQVVLDPATQRLIARATYADGDEWRMLMDNHVDADTIVRLDNHA